MEGANPDSLRELVEGSGLSFRQTSVSWVFTCPRCQKREKLYIRKRDGRFVCWHCVTTIGYQGRPEFALRDLLGLPMGDLRDRLYGGRSGTISDSPLLFAPPLADFFDDPDDAPWDLIPLPEIAWGFDHLSCDETAAKPGVDYLLGRGIPLELMIKLDIHYDATKRRMCFPVVVDHRMVGWQGRLIDSDPENNDPKILTEPKGLDRSQCLMFQDSIVDHAIVMEGPVDAIKAIPCGGAVATMGAEVSEGQIDIIASRAKRVYIGTDPDAEIALNRLCRAFRERGVSEIYRMTPNETVDPCVKSHHSLVKRQCSIGLRDSCRWCGAVAWKDFGEMSFARVFKRFQRAQPVSVANLFIPTLRDIFV